MPQDVPDPPFQSAAAVTAPIVPTGRPAAVTAAGVVMLVFAVLGGVSALVALFYRVIDLSRFNSIFVVVFRDFEFQFTLLMFVLCVVVALLAIGVWQGSSVARLAAFAALGAAVTATAALTASYLASVVYGLDRLYEDDWRQYLIRMWAYLFAAAILAVPIPLLNRPAATKWFRRRRSARSHPTAEEPMHRPEVLTLVTTALAVLALLTVIAEAWRISTILSGTYGDVEDIPESLIRTLAHATIPLLILTAAIIEIGAGSRLGQTAAVMASGYACFQIVERFPILFSGSWLNDWQQFGIFFTTAAIGGVGAVTLFLLLRPRVVDYLAYQAVDLEPDYELAAEDEDDED